MHTNRSHALRRLAGLLGTTTAAIALSFAGSPGTADAAPVPTACTLYASPIGSDAGTGAADRPFQSLPRLAAALTPGTVGCLRAGIYQLPSVPAARGGAVQLLNLTKGGTPAAPAVLRNAPGADVRVVGRIVITPAAANLVIAGLTLDGGGTLNDEASSVTVLANNVALKGNTITAPTRICVSIGAYGSSRVTVTGTVVEGNRIHHCGDDRAWGAVRTGYAHNQEHGVYVEGARGTIIQHNIIDHNDARGVQLFADADGTVVQNNIIDANTSGINIGGWAGAGFNYGRSEGNILRNNLITNSSRMAVEVNWDGVAAPTGSLTNLIDGNCVFGSNPNAVLGSTQGITWAAGNRWADPQYNNLSSGDYRLTATSPCIGKGVMPTVQAVTPTAATRTAITSTAVVSPHRMTAAYSLRVRLCSNATCTGTFGAWSSSATATAVDVVDVRVSGSVGALLPGRSYQAQWVVRQALLPAGSSGASTTSAAFVVTTKA
ncbi:MAG: right-handed parallel beta-helix repeat-containing protein [Actinomycetota bacterium]|nr:right-handed parallel beta-helix repeat-containing protein [Actinomycetota bacterium]